MVHAAIKQLWLTMTIILFWGQTILTDCLSCGTGESCCNDFCMPDGSRCCNNVYCPGSWECCSDTQCYPPSTVCCFGGGHCDPGYSCCYEDYCCPPGTYCCGGFTCCRFDLFNAKQGNDGNLGGSKPKKFVYGLKSSSKHSEVKKK